MKLNHDLYSDRTKVKYETLEEWRWMPAPTLPLRGRRMLEAFGIIGPPTLPREVTIYSSYLRYWQEELAAAGDQPPELSPYSDMERAAMLGLAGFIDNHFGGADKMWEEHPPQQVEG